MKNGVMGAIFVVIVGMGVGAVQPVDATPLVTRASHDVKSGTSSFCNDWCRDLGLSSSAWPFDHIMLDDAHIFQFNLCVGCAGATQTNVAKVTQVDSLIENLLQLAKPVGTESDSDGQAVNFQTNVARVVQLNLCVDCMSLTQINEASLELGSLLTSVASGYTISSHVPEPGTLLLLTSGIVALGLRRCMARDRHTRA
jgi:hypothetical protein